MTAIPNEKPSMDPKWVHGGPCSVTAMKTDPLRRMIFPTDLWTPRRASLHDGISE